MDPVADMLSSIKNAQATLKEEVLVPYSNLKMSIAEILEKEKLIKDVKKMGRVPHKQIVIGLKYDEDKKPAIKGLKKISKPGQRIYKTAGDLRPVKGGFGTAII